MKYVDGYVLLKEKPADLRRMAKGGGVFHEHGLGTCWDDLETKMVASFPRDKISATRRSFSRDRVKSRAHRDGGFLKVMETATGEDDGSKAMPFDSAAWFSGFKVMVSL
jgi:uncharacterized protein YbaA (DUF1428 family)